MLKAWLPTAGTSEAVSCRTRVAPTDLPESVLHYVIRTQDSLLLDATDESPFSGDEYIRQKRCRSVSPRPVAASSVAGSTPRIPASVFNTSGGPARIVSATRDPQSVFMLGTLGPPQGGGITRCG